MNLKTLLSAQEKAFPISSTENRQKQLKTMKSVKALDDNIYMLEYQSDYDIDGLLKEGVSSIGGLLKFMAKRSHLSKKAFKIGEVKGGGCSTFNAVTPDGDYILGRNFDFKIAPCMVLWTHPENHYASISMVDTNFLAYGTYVNKYNKINSYQSLLAPYCCVDGINEKGLSIAVLQIRAKPTKQTDTSKKNITTTAMIRAVLDTCADVDEAVKLFSAYNMNDSLGVAYHYQLADASGRSVVIEYIDNKLYVYEKNNEAYGITGSVYEEDKVDFQYVSNYSITKNTGSYKVEQHGEDRTEAVINSISNKNGVLTEIEAMDLLSYVKLDYDHPKYPWRVGALWSAVYNTNKKTVMLAANMDYSKVYTFGIDSPCKVLEKEGISKTAYPVGNWKYL